LTALVPAGADVVSAQAAMAFAAQGASMLALNTAAQEELSRAGTALTNITRMLTEVDTAAGGALVADGSQFSSGMFTGGTGAGLLRAETLPGAAGSPARTPLMANLIDGVASPNPATTMPPAAASAASMAPSTALGAAAAATAPLSPIGQGATTGGTAGGLASAAANAASTAVGAASGPLSSLTSLAQGASAGGAAGPALASSLTEDQGEGEPDNSGEEQRGERLL
jgi:hypothetical protein